MFLSRLRLYSNLNPLPSCEGRPDLHPEEGDEVIFQSTPLVRGETAPPLEIGQHLEISIHSPRARGDRLKSHRLKSP